MAGKEQISFDEVMESLEKRIFRPVYLLHGEEPYFIDMISDYIEENVLSETEKEFNQSVLYGMDVDVPTIISYARRFPMMSEYQVIIIKEAQDIDELETLEDYVKQPVPSTILVICYKHKKFDQRTTFVKSVKKEGIAFYAEKIYENKVPSWITAYLKEKGYGITPKASVLLTEYLGSDLSKISKELEKIFINVPRGIEIDDLTIEENIGISKDYNIFELQNALGRKNILKANQICNYFAANPKEHPLVRTIAILYSFFVKLLFYHATPDKSRTSIASALSVHPFFVNEFQIAARNYPYERIEKIISLLSEYDLRSKGYNNASTPQGELLKELVYKILH